MTGSVRSIVAGLVSTPTGEGATPMDWTELQAELNLLLTEMENQPEDRHELYLQLREKLSEIRAFGMPVPDDLKKLERDLEQEFAAEMKGQGSPGET